jgi:hypothetical protein
MSLPGIPTCDTTRLVGEILDSTLQTAFNLDEIPLIALLCHYKRITTGICCSLGNPHKNNFSLDGRL